MNRAGRFESKNYGYGRDMGFAGKQALRDRFGGGHFASVATHAQRFDQFAQFMREQHGIRDMRRITPEHVQAYANALRDQGYAVSTRQNAVSTVNTVLTQAGAGRWQPLSPRKLVGEARCNLRQSGPGSLDRNNVSGAAQAMRDSGIARAAAAAELARSLGVREREAALADLNRWKREADGLGRINVLEGTKGGRNAPRWVPVTPAARSAIDAALEARPHGSGNLMAPGETYKTWLNGELRDGRTHLKEQGIKGYHDARAAYACERYQQITGHPAPCTQGRVTASRELDLLAREAISRELGHGRIDVVVSYIGGRS